MTVTTEGFDHGSVIQNLVDVNSPNVKLKYNIIMNSEIKMNKDGYITTNEYGSFDELESKLKEPIEIGIIGSSIKTTHTHDQKKIESIKTVSKQIRDVLNYITYSMYRRSPIVFTYLPKAERDYIDNLESNGIKIKSFADIDVEKRFGFSTPIHLMSEINNYLKNSEEILKKESKRLPEPHQRQPEDFKDFRKTLHELLGIMVNFGLSGDDEFCIMRIIQNKSGFIA